MIKRSFTPDKKTLDFNKGLITFCPTLNENILNNLKAAIPGKKKLTPKRIIMSYLIRMI